MTLQEIYLKHKKGDWPDKNSVHSYIPVYEQILAPYRKTAKNILEIGLMGGESLRMWTEYFTGTVHGIDCDIKPINGQADLTEAIKDCNIVIGDATNSFDIWTHFKGIKFDVIIEDANHDIQQQLLIYNTMRPYLAEGAIYIIEDIQDIDSTRHLFNGEIIDLRKNKGRYDDCLVIIK